MSTTGKLIAIETRTHRRLSKLAKLRGKSIKAVASAIIDSYYRRDNKNRQRAAMKYEPGEPAEG